MSNITIEELKSAFIKADDAGNIEDARLFANAIRAYQTEFEKPPEGFKDYEDIVPKEVRQKERERMQQIPLWALPTPTGFSMMPMPQAGQAAQEFSRYLGFGKYGQKKVLKV